MSCIMFIYIEKHNDKNHKYFQRNIPSIYTFENPFSDFSVKGIN